MLGTIKKIFFENIGIRQTVFKNTFWLGLYEVVTAFLRFILIIYVVRILGAEEYGKFAFAFSFVSTIAIFSDLGVADIATREFSRNKEKEKDFSDFLTLGLILSAFALLLITIGSFFITSDFDIRKIIWVLGIFILINSIISIFCSLLRSRQKMEYEAGIRIAQALIMTGAAFFIIFYIPSALNLSYGYLFSNIVIVSAVLALFHFYFQSIELKYNRDAFQILKISWPLSFGFTVGWICLNINSIMLGYFNLLTENGWYNASVRIIYILIMFAGLVIRSFYPMLSNFFVSSKERLQKSWDYMMRSIIFLTFPMVIGGIVLASKIIYFFYGPEFAPSIQVFKFLTIAAGIIFINLPFSAMLIVADQQKKNFIVIVAGILINIILNVLLIPLYGIHGATVSAIISFAIVLLLTIIFAKDSTNLTLFDRGFLRDFVVAAISGYLMFLVIKIPAVYGLNVFLIAVIGALVYSFAFFSIVNLIVKE